MIFSKMRMGRREMSLEKVGWAMAVLLVVAWSGIASAQEWYPCDKIPTEFRLESEASILYARNGTLIVSPKDGKGNVMSNDYVGLKLRGFQEWLTDEPGTCSEPDYYHYPGTRNNDRVAYTGFQLHELECKRERIIDYLPNGAQVETIRTFGRNSSYPDLKITFNTTKPLGDYFYSYGNSTNTGGVDYNVRYSTASMKISLEIENFPFSAPTNRSHVIVYITGLAHVSYSDYNLSYIQNDQALEFRVISHDQNLVFKEDLDRGFLLDGEPYMNALHHYPRDPTPFPAGFNLPEIDTSFAFCHWLPPGFRPQVFYWDPQLSAIFKVTEEPTNPNTPSSSKKFPWVIVVATVVPVVFVIIVIFIIAVILSPTLQNFFMPYKTKHNDAGRSAVHSRWKQTAASPRE